MDGNRAEFQGLHDISLALPRLLFGNNSSNPVFQSKGY